MLDGGTLGSSLGGGVRARGSREKKVFQKGEVRYPVVDVEPSSPRIALSERTAGAWQTRLRSACAHAGSPWRGEGALEEEQKGTDALAAPLDWYAEELSFVCGRALIPAAARLLALQARHIAGPGLLDDSQPFWAMLLETATLFAAAAYHVHRAAEVLVSEVGNLLLRRGTAAATPPQHCAAGGGPESGGQRRLPTPLFPPRGANAALAALHLDVARLQSAGPQLAAALKRLAQGTMVQAENDVRTLLDELPIKGNKGAFGNHSFGGASKADGDPCGPQRFQMLLMAVPCIEEAMERLGTLVCMVERSQAANANFSANANSKKKTQITGGSEIADDDDDFITEEDVGAGDGGLDMVAEKNQDLIEAAAMAESPEPSAKASASPASARRRCDGPQSEDAASTQSGNESAVSQREPPSEKRRSAETPRRTSVKSKKKRGG